MTPAMIDPRALRTFHEVCRAGSITGAARALNISQPSVSSAIALLEAMMKTDDTLEVMFYGH
jgi:DNA-binding transcriptional LysR family regulator